MSSPLTYLVLFSSTTNKWKIADFGLTSEAISTQLVTTRYSRGRNCYRAPELLHETTAKYSVKSDIWAFGCLVFEMITGRKAFASDYAVGQYAESRVPLLHRVDVSTNLLKVFHIEKVLEIDAKARPRAVRLKVLSSITQCILTSSPSASDLEAPMMSGLLFAAGRGRLDLVEFLVNETSGFPSRVMRKEWIEAYGQALGRACKNKHEAIMDVLERAGAERGRALIYVSSIGDCDAIRLLLQRGVEVNWNYTGLTALAHASSRRHVEATRLLLDEGATIHADDLGILREMFAADANPPVALRQAILQAKRRFQIEDHGFRLGEWDIRDVTEREGGEPAPTKSNREQWFTIAERARRKVHVSLLNTFSCTMAPLSACLSPDGTHLAMFNEHALNIFHVASGKLETSFAHLDYQKVDSLTSVQFAYDSFHFIVAAKPESIPKLYLCAVDAGKIQKVFSGAPGFDTICFDISQNQDKLAWGTSDGRVSIWRTKSAQRLFKLDINCRSVAFSPRGDMLAVGSDSKVSIWNIRSRKVVAVIPDCHVAVFSPSVKSAWELLVFNHQIMSAALWRLTRKGPIIKKYEVIKRFEIRRTYKRIDLRRTVVRISPDGKWVVQLGGQSVRFYDMSRKQPTTVLFEPGESELSKCPATSVG